MMDGQLLGKEILAKTDMLIEVILSVELSDGKEKEIYQEQGAALVKEISGLLEKMIGPREEYIRDALKELVAQRMPDNVSNSIDDEYFKCLYQSGDSQVEPQVVHYTIDPLQRAINHLFSQFNIIKNYRYQGCIFSYYIPSLKIAIDDCSRSPCTNPVLKKYICRQIGINYVSISSHEVPCSREIIREIKRRLDINNYSVLK
ncbi:MAG TPA: hypothetical protein GXX59_03560 [Syntrophomonadaceae bacterium]|nr:hypothetical protein [Syntrophomonadaceae bacterium]